MQEWGHGAEVRRVFFHTSILLQLLQYYVLEVSRVEGSSAYFLMTRTLRRWHGHDGICPGPPPIHNPGQNRTGASELELKTKRCENISKL